MNPSIVQDVLDEMDDPRRAAVIAAAPEEEGQPWTRNRTYPEDSAGRLVPHAPREA